MAAHERRPDPRVPGRSAPPVVAAGGARGGGIRRRGVVCGRRRAGAPRAPRGAGVVLARRDRAGAWDGAARGGPLRTVAAGARAAGGAGDGAPGGRAAPSPRERPALVGAAGDDARARRLHGADRRPSGAGRRGAGAARAAAAGLDAPRDARAGDRGGRRRRRRGRAVHLADGRARVLDAGAHPDAVRRGGRLDDAARRRRPHHLQLSGLHRAPAPHRRRVDGGRRRAEGDAHPRSRPTRCGRPGARCCCWARPASAGRSRPRSRAERARRSRRT